MKPYTKKELSDRRQALQRAIEDSLDVLDFPDATDRKRFEMSPVHLETMAQVILDDLTDSGYLLVEGLCEKAGPVSSAPFRIPQSHEPRKSMIPVCPFKY